MAKLIIAVIIFFTPFAAKTIEHSKIFYAQKNITVTVDNKGWIYIGKDTLTTEQLAEELQNRLWKSYLGTGKMYHAIRLEHAGEVLPEIEGSVKKAIHEGQQKALTDICLQLHKKLYEDLSHRQQRKIKNQFPVLFQQNY